MNELSGRPLLEKLTKWRTVFASWQLGTRAETDGELKAVKDHRELTILLRAELTAITGLLIEKGIFTAEEHAAAMDKEARLLDADYEARFLGFSTSLEGVHMEMPRVAETMRNLGFPP